MSALWWLGLACLAAGLGLGLWIMAQHRQQVQTMSDRVERLIHADAHHAPLPSGADAAVPSDWQQRLPAWALYAYSPKKRIWGAVMVVLLTVLIGLVGNVIMAVIALILMVGAACFWAWMQWQRYKKRVLQQLPSFIDGMVRMVVLGHSTQSAFVAAAGNAKEPLRKVVAQAASFSKAGMSIDQSIRTASRSLELKEFLLLAAVVQVGSKFGGRIDSLLERVADFMRDKEQADRELRALSAEVRVSAWILSLLPLVVGGAIITLNAAYFMKMWDDPVGRWIALGGLGLQAIGAFCLYRLARLDE